jgi:hypothetical protein
VRLHVADRSFVGRAVDLRARGVTVPPDAVAAAVRRETDGRSPDAAPGGDAPSVVVACRTPGALHRLVGLVDDRPLRSRRRLLAAVARSRGETAPQDDEIRALRERLDELPNPSVDVAALRERVAAVGDREATLRERAATLRGELSARRETDAPTGDVAAELASVTGDLAAVETERIAAEQALRRGEAAAREARDARERRLRLTDRLANRRRAARRVLAERVADPVEAAATRLPGPGEGPATTRLAAVAVGVVEAPVVLAVERFESALAARRALGAEVVRV